MTRLRPNAAIGCSVWCGVLALIVSVCKPHQVGRAAEKTRAEHEQQETGSDVSQRRRSIRRIGRCQHHDRRIGVEQATDQHQQPDAGNQNSEKVSRLHALNLRSLAGRRAHRTGEDTQCAALLGTVKQLVRQFPVSNCPINSV